MDDPEKLWSRLLAVGLALSVGTLIAGAFLVGIGAAHNKGTLFTNGLACLFAGGVVLAAVVIALRLSKDL